MTLREQVERRLEGFRAHKRGEAFDPNQDQDWRTGWVLYSLHLANHK